GTILAAATVNNPGLIKVWNVTTGAEIFSWDGSRTFSAAIAPDNKTLATGHHDGTIVLRDLTRGEKKRTLMGHTGPVCWLKFTPDGQTLVSSSEDGTIRMWNPEQVRARHVIPLGSPNRMLRMDLDPSGQYVIAGGQGPVIFVLRLPKN